MLIKLQKESGSPDYIIYEDVTNITYSTTPKPKPEGAWELPDIFYYNHLSPSSPDDAGKLHLIECHVGAQNLRIWFDGEAFICNNDGKTIQRINAL